MKITPIILSGGSGTRLWPLSRKSSPKQFLKLFDEFSLFQKTILRVTDDRYFNAPIVVCNNEHRFMVAEELKQINISAESIILEPIAKNTAAAISAAAFEVAEKFSNQDLMLVMPCDHLIKKEKEFIEAVKSSVKSALDDNMVTFGILPKNVETGFGYIKKGAQIKDLEIFRVDKFVEKPSEEKAKEMIEDGNFFFNSGIFLFKASVFLANLSKLQNDVFVNVKNAYKNSLKDLDFIRLAAADFEKCSDISIDYAVMEKSKNISLKIVDIDWSDVGSWKTLSEISEKDSSRNNIIGDVVSIKTSDCYIHSKYKLTTTIGVENLIIISLKDVVLVASKDNAQDVKKLFEELKKYSREECDSHLTSFRPWGSFETIDFGDRFKVKRITVKPKSSLSLQLHHHRAEHWVVVKGSAIVSCDDKKFILSEDQSTYIPLGKKHRLENEGETDLEIIEIQTGNILSEDDIVRFSDIYGR
jgi:mannose-1-phosphate guanylyltransferase/mannose-6-phosphate isomerase